MDQKAIRGVPWTLLTYAINKGLTFGTTIVLARVLVPADFGVVALASLAIGVIGLFKDLGLGGALVLRQDLDERAQGTIQTLMLISGVVVTIVIIASAPLVADLLDEPRLDSVLAVMALSIPLGSVGWFYETLLQRQLEFRKRFLAQAYQNVVYAALALTLAFAGAGVWSIVIAFVTGMAVYAVALLLLVPRRIAPRWNADDARDAFSTGRGFLAQGGLGFVQQNADKLVVGSALGSTQLGYYSMSYRICELPYMAIADPVARVTFPEFARMHSGGEDVSVPFLSVLRLTAIVTVPIGIVISCTADPFVEAVLGSSWVPMTGSLMVLGLWAAIRPLQTTVSWLLNSLGHAGLMGLISAFVLVPLIPALIIAAVHSGIAAVSWAMLADILLSLATLGWFADRRCGVSLRRQWHAIAPVMLAGPPAWLAGWGVARATEDIASGIALVAASAASLLVFLAVMAIADREAIGAATRQIGSTLGRGEPATAEIP